MTVITPGGAVTVTLSPRAVAAITRGAAFAGGRAPFEGGVVFHGHVDVEMASAAWAGIEMRTAAAAALELDSEAHLELELAFED